MKDKTMEKKNHNITLANVIIVSILQMLLRKVAGKITPGTLFEADGTFPISLILLRKVEVHLQFIFIKFCRRSNKDFHVFHVSKCCAVIYECYMDLLIGQSIKFISSQCQYVGQIINNISILLYLLGMPL